MRYVLILVGALLLCSQGWVAWAASDPLTAEKVQTNANYVWTLLSAGLVFFMQAGFALVETGFTRAKNAVNIMMKNLMDFCLGALAFWAVGFALMFGTNATGFFGSSWYFVADKVPEGADTAWPLAFYFFQVVFAATAATIVSGAMAERTRFVAYLIYSVVISLVIYPVFGSWAWNGLFGTWNGGTKGWLEQLGFIDFAGSTVVHSIGGWVALAGAFVIGPRIGRYDNGNQAIPGHNLPMAMLGVFVLWLGWLGFNGGSTTTANTDTAGIIVNTFLAGAAGATGAMFTSWAAYRKPDMALTGNGVLAGLVAITAPCATVTMGGSVIIGAFAGVLVIFAVALFDRLKIDDPVGAISVHGVCGAYGTLCAGIPLFAKDPSMSWSQLGVQAIGVGAAFAWALGTGLALFFVIQAVVGLRVSREEETSGLDLGEHAALAYYDFQATQQENLQTSKMAPAQQQE